MRTKKEDQVWVRWFYISNCGELQSISKDNIDQHIGSLCARYSSDFKEKAMFEIIDGNTVTIIKANEVTI